MGLSGRLKPRLKSELEAEGLVLLEEGLKARVRYKHFKAPGKRFHGKVTGERVGLGISRERLVVYCRWGFAKLIDTPFASERLELLEVAVGEQGAVEFRIDYDRADVPKVSGQVTIEVHAADAQRVVREIEARRAR